MSGLEDDPPITIEHSDRWFTPEALRPIHELNRRLLAILIEESGKSTVPPDLSALGELLAALSPQVLERLAALPISLVDAAFQTDDAWSSVDLGHRTHSGH